MKILKEDFDVELEEELHGGDISRFLGVDIVRNKDKSMAMTSSLS